MKGLFSAYSKLIKILAPAPLALAIAGCGPSVFAAEDSRSGQETVRQNFAGDPQQAAAHAPGDFYSGRSTGQFFRFEVNYSWKHSW